MHQSYSPKPEEDLIKALAASGKPLVVVLMNGSALGVNWVKGHANAILESCTPARKEGPLSLKPSAARTTPPPPSRHLLQRCPTSFHTLENYLMKGRTYPNFEGEPLWPFGFGLSYTTFAYSNLTLPDTPTRGR